MNPLASGDINIKVDTEINENIKKEFSFKWTVQKISRIPKSVPSMRFSLAGDQNKDWFAIATILPDKQDAGKRGDKFKVSLTCVSGKSMNLRIEHTSKAFDSKMQSLGGTSSGPLLFQEQGEECVLLDEISCPADDGDVIFECSMIIHGFHLNTTYEEEFSIDEPDKDLVEYVDGFRAIMHDESLSDLKIHTESRCFRVHKCVLHARAPTFFELHQKDIAKGKIVLKDISSSVFQLLLEYIYTGEEGAVMNRDDYRKLYRLAHDYALADLQRRCAKVLSEYLSVYSMVDIFLLADKCKDELLMMACRVFMRQNMNNIEKTLIKQWNDLLKDKPNLMQEIMKVHE